MPRDLGPTFLQASNVRVCGMLGILISKLLGGLEGLHCPAAHLSPFNLDLKGPPLNLDDLFLVHPSPPPL